MNRAAELGLADPMVRLKADTTFVLVVERNLYWLRSGSMILQPATKHESAIIR